MPSTRQQQTVQKAAPRKARPADGKCSRQRDDQRQRGRREGKLEAVEERRDEVGIVEDRAEPAQRETVHGQRQRLVGREGDQYHDRKGSQHEQDHERMKE
jgi:hypothetical protein